MVKGTPVKLILGSRDVIHDVGLTHFRLKMDAVPGIPTYFVFTPTKTTEEFRQDLRKYKEYNVPSDPTDPNSPPKWQTFNFELNRDYQDNPNIALAKSRELALLLSEMRKVAADKILRDLASIHL